MTPLQNYGGVFGVLFFVSLVTFVAFAGLWGTGIILPIAWVRWALQLNAVVIVTSFVATLITNA